VKYYIGIDNGPTGSITILDPDGFLLHSELTPVKKELSYTKDKKKITRVSYKGLAQILAEYLPKKKRLNQLCVIERPMVNPIRFKNSLSAIRALEATLIALEILGVPYQYIDSREWQKVFLPTAKKKKVKGVSNSAELKKDAVNIAQRLYPGTNPELADSLLIATYARRRRL
jgi:hypothetical protein